MAKKAATPTPATPSAKVPPTRERIIISYPNLTPELLDAFREHYPTGYSEAMIRVDKPTGDFFYVVPLETATISYLVKVDVKIDTKPEEELEKDYYDTEEDESGDIAGAEQIAETSEEDE